MRFPGRGRRADGGRRGPRPRHGRGAARRHGRRRHGRRRAPRAPGGMGGPAGARGMGAMMPLLAKHVTGLVWRRKPGRLPGPIVETNGTKGEDGTTVSWKLAWDDLKDGKAEAQSVTFKGEGLDLKPFTVRRSARRTWMGDGPGGRGGPRRPRRPAALRAAPAARAASSRAPEQSSRVSRGPSPRAPNRVAMLLGAAGAQAAAPAGPGTRRLRPVPQTEDLLRGRRPRPAHGAGLHVPRPGADARAREGRRAGDRPVPRSQEGRDRHRDRGDERPEEGPRGRGVCRRGAPPPPTSWRSGSSSRAGTAGRSGRPWPPCSRGACAPGSASPCGGGPASRGRSPWPRPTPTPFRRRRTPRPGCCAASRRPGRPGGARARPGRQGLREPDRDASPGGVDHRRERGRHLRPPRGGGARIPCRPRRGRRRHPIHRPRHRGHRGRAAQGRLRVLPPRGDRLGQDGGLPSGDRDRCGGPRAARRSCWCPRSA